MALNLKTLTTKLFIRTFSKPEWHGARRLAIIYWGLKIQESKSRSNIEHQILPTNLEKTECNRIERFRVMAEGIKSVLVEEIGRNKTEDVLSRYRIG